MRKATLLLACLCAASLMRAQEQGNQNPTRPAEHVTEAKPVSEPVVAPIANPSAEKAVAPAAADEFRSKDNFHIVGLPNVKRNGRVDVVATKTELRFEHDGKYYLVIPYSRLRNMEVISGERHFGKSAFAAAMATPFGIGSLFILKKRHVDTMILEFKNQRDGVMNAVVQFPEGEGVRCGEFMSKYGVPFEPIKSPIQTETKK